jgi:citrate synthase
MSNIHFEITEKQLDTGMRGYPVGYCITSSVDPHKGLHYCGIPLAEIVDSTPIEVIYLLYHGKKGSELQISSFFEELKHRAILSAETKKAIESLPKAAHPMKLFSMALLILETFEGTQDYQQDCLNVIAKLPHLVACVINQHAGWGNTSPPDPELGYMASFTEMVNVPKKDPHLKDAFKFFNVLHYDHGGGNLSAFVGKAVASGLETMMGALSASMCALAGPRHGSANQQTLEFVKSFHTELDGKVSAESVELLIRSRLENNQLVFGFGHAVLRVEDPRASVMYDFIERHYGGHPLVQTALLLREVGPKVLSENPKIKNPYPNIDAASGVMLTASGFGYPEYYTVLFGLSRCVGIAIQILYERCLARGGKGTPIIRPKYLYKSRLG